MVERAGTVAGFIQPQWPTPAGVGSLLTNRHGGASTAPYDGFNLAAHVSDSSDAVASNRARLQQQLRGLPVQWLQQVHGDSVVVAGDGSQVKSADAVITRRAGIACAVLTADCLPLLICDRAATCVAAVHAGWRGLVNGIVAKAVAAMNCPGESLLVYLGPAISQANYEVGIEVVEAVFDAADSTIQSSALANAIKPGQRPMHFYIDLYAIARAQLAACGIHQVFGGEYCTLADAQFYSHRRDGVTGRQASLIWLTP